MRASSESSAPMEPLSDEAILFYNLSKLTARLGQGGSTPATPGSVKAPPAVSAPAKEEQSARLSSWLVPSVPDLSAVSLLQRVSRAMTEDTRSSRSGLQTQSEAKTAPAVQLPVTSNGRSISPVSPRFPPSQPKVAPAPVLASSAVPPQADRSNAPYRLSQFESLINSDVVDIIALRKISWNGVPHRFRRIVWPLLLGYFPVRKERRDETLRRKRHEYQELIPLHFDSTHPMHYPDDNDPKSMEKMCWHQILLDLPRTGPNHPFFHQKPVRKLLERVLYIWSVRHPAAGYVQGMNDILTPIILICCQQFVDDPHRCDTTKLDLTTLSIIEADSYWCFSKLMENIQDHYTLHLPGLQRMIMRLEKLVHRLDKELHDHFVLEDLRYIQFAFRWMNCVLLREMPLHCIYRLWDTYFAEGKSGFENFHVYVCVVLLRKYREQLLQMNFQDLIMFLQDLPTGGWEEEDVEPILSEAFVLSTLFDNAPSHLQAPVITST